jgi:hypothetical protein
MGDARRKLVLIMAHHDQGLPFALAIVIDDAPHQLKGRPWSW